MRKAAARRLALWANAQYLMGTDTTGFSDGALDDDADVAVLEAANALGAEMLKRSGIPLEVGEAEAIRIADELTARKRTRPR